MRNTPFREAQAEAEARARASRRTVGMRAHNVERERLPVGRRERAGRRRAATRARRAEGTFLRASVADRSHIDFDVAVRVDRPPGHRVYVDASALCD